MNKINDIEALRPAALEILKTLDTVSARVGAELQGAPMTSDALANQNEEVIRRAMAQIVARASQRVSELHRLKDEPAIARIVARDVEGQEFTYYICRGMPPSGAGVRLASQRAPIGALASVLPGDSIELDRVGWLEVLENAQLRPQHDLQGWDSVPTVFRTEALDARTASSLKELLGALEPADDQDFMALIEADGGTPVLEEGVRRAIIHQMALRDQPTLDRLQDEVFRLPFVSRLALLGPPGTGKTTTLIRRVGQKLDVFYLAEDEQRLVERLAQESGREHRQNWLMFTPTPLLKDYVKDAFAREDVAASERVMKTWSEFRSDIARHHLNLLRIADGKPGFVLKNSAVHLKERPDWQAWFEDFETWQSIAWRARLRDACEVLEASDASAKAVARQALKLLQDHGNLVSLGIALADLASTARKEAEIVDGSAREILRGWNNDRLKVDRAFATQLAEQLARLQAEELAVEEEEREPDDEADEERLVSVAPNSELDAMRAHEQALRALARARALGRSVPRQSRTGKILAWLSDRVPDSKSLTALGRRLQEQSALRQLANPSQGLMRTVSRDYREFRRLRQQEGRWYASDSPLGNEVDKDELDLLLVVLLRRAQTLLGRASVRAQIDQPTWSALRPYRTLLRAQVLVDEATDFSPLQLAAMAALVHPDSRSFFACGDFHQRLTSWGTRDEAELGWAIPSITVRTLQTPYRQTRQLASLANKILELTGQVPVSPEAGGHSHQQEAGYPPVLGEKLADSDALADWVAARIKEVESNVQPGTSIAVLVPEEEQVGPMADALRERLAAINLDVQACRDGRTVGAGHVVRVFDVQHIKGLEFEAVFLVGLDTLLALQPDLFDKYLYVGATRAASCLGLACANQLPTALEGLRPLFHLSWSPR